MEETVYFSHFPYNFKKIVDIFFKECYDSHIEI
jgi:hypothetical protein